MPSRADATTSARALPAPNELSATPTSLRLPRDAALDGLRGIAIALVVWRHLIFPFLPIGRATWLGWLRTGTNLAWCGVDLFFVLSGFLIGGILIDHRNSPRLGRVFYVRRALRILPLYYVTLGVIFLLVALRAPHAYKSFSAGTYLLFLTNFAVAASQTWDWGPLSLLWSLAVEEQFYLAAPWIIRVISPRRLPWLLVTLIVGACLLRIAVMAVFHAGELPIHVQMPFRMDTLALGFLVAWAVRTPSADPLFGHLGRWWKCYLAGGVLAVGVLAWMRPAEGTFLLAAGGYTLIASVFALTVAIVVRVRPPQLNRWLAARPLTHLGRHSYFVYLWHYIIGTYTINFLLGETFVLDTLAKLAVVLAGIAATWTAAAISWRFFEGPLVARGHRWSYD